MSKNTTHPLTPPSTYKRGQCAERIAQSYLEARGYILIEKNFRWKGGEIDLVMLEPSRELVFAEVRSSERVSPWLRYSIGPQKRRRLVKTGMAYALRRKWARGHAFRFDVVWIENTKVEHWRNVAF